MLSDIGPGIKLKSLQKNKASNFKRERGSETQPFYFETEKKEMFFFRKINETKFCIFTVSKKLEKAFYFFFCWFFRSIFL